MNNEFKHLDIPENLKLDINFMKPYRFSAFNALKALHKKPGAYMENRSELQKMIHRVYITVES